MGVAEGVARLAQLLTIALLGRILGPAGLGIVGVAWAVFQLAAPFVQYAPELIGARLVAQGVDIDKAFVDVTTIKLVVGFVCAVVMAAGAAIAFAHEPAERLQVAVQALLPLAVALNGVWAFRGLRRFSAYAVVRSAQSAGLLGALTLALVAVPRAWIVPVCEVVVGLAAAGLAYGLMFDWRKLPALIAATSGRVFALRAEFGEAVRFGFGSFFASAVWSLPLLIAPAFLGLTDQGYLAAALRLILALMAPYQLALQVFHPVLAHRYATNRAAAAGLSAALVVYAVVTTIPVTAALILFAPWIVTPLLGVAFTHMASVLAMLSLAVVPTVVGSVFGYALLADGRYGLYLWICAGGAAATLVACTAAFYVWPHPESVVVLAAVATLVALASAVAAWRPGLVRFRDVRLGQLSPKRIKEILVER